NATEIRRRKATLLHIYYTRTLHLLQNTHTISTRHFYSHCRLFRTAHQVDRGVWGDETKLSFGAEKGDRHSHRPGIKYSAMTRHISHNVLNKQYLQPQHTTKYPGINVRFHGHESLEQGPRATEASRPWNRSRETLGE